MTDTQNLFRESSPYGNWQINRGLEKLAAEGKADVIIVAIDYRGQERIKEFYPYANPKHGRMEMRFLMHWATRKRSSSELNSLINGFMHITISDNTLRN